MGNRRPKQRYRTQAYYDTYEGWIVGYNVIDTQTGQQHGLYSRNHAYYLARKWNKQGNVT